jgi:membrane-bound ClpP family serine protease
MTVRKMVGLGNPPYAPVRTTRSNSGSSTPSSLIGWAEIDGVRWRARLADGAKPPEAGATMSIADTNGMMLIVGLQANRKVLKRNF